MRIVPLGVVLALAWAAPPARADDSKLRKDGLAPDHRGALHRAKRKVCCGYPLVPRLGWKITFYWMAEQTRWPDEGGEVDVYTPEGWFLGTFPDAFVAELKMEGSGWLADGRVINYAGRCRLGVGTCFETLDGHTHPYGRGAGLRPLVPFVSVAVDRKLVPIGEPMYIPELDGMPLPDGSVHDGCVRADDTGSAIKKRLMDFFVVELENFRWVRDHLWGVRWMTPSIEDPRCEYLRDPR